MVPKKVKILAASVVSKTYQCKWSWNCEGPPRTKWKTRCGHLPPPKATTQSSGLSPHSVTQAPQCHSLAASLDQPLIILKTKTKTKTKVLEPCSRFLGFSWSSLPTFSTNIIMWLAVYLTHHYTTVYQYSQYETRTIEHQMGSRGTGYSLSRGSDQSGVTVGRELRM